MTRAQEWMVRGVICIGLLWCGVARSEVSPEIFEAFEGDTITITTTHGIELTGKLKKVNSAKMSIVFIQAGGKVALIKMAEVASVKATADLGGATATQTSGAAQSGQPAQAVMNAACSQLAASLAQVQLAEQGFQSAKAVCSAAAGAGSKAGKSLLSEATSSVPFGGVFASAGGKAIGAGVESACLNIAEAVKLTTLIDAYNSLNTKCNGTGAVAYSSASLTAIIQAQAQGGAGGGGASGAPQGMSPELKRHYQDYLYGVTIRTRKGRPAGPAFAAYLEERGSAMFSVGVYMALILSGTGIGLLGYALIIEENKDQRSAKMWVGGAFGFTGVIVASLFVGSAKDYRRLAEEARSLQKTSSTDGLQLRGFTELRDVAGKPAGVAMTFSF